MAEWMPIESAPRDGQKILGWNKWDGVLVFERYRYGSNDRFEGWRAVYDCEDFAGPPTHWMPLPEPPEVKP